MILLQRPVGGEVCLGFDAESVGALITAVERALSGDRGATELLFERRVTEPMSGASSVPRTLEVREAGEAVQVAEHGILVRLELRREQLAESLHLLQSCAASGGPQRLELGDIEAGGDRAKLVWLYDDAALSARQRGAAVD